MPILLTVAAAALAYVMLVVSRQTIDVVRARHLLPRWDLATHLGHGWLDYYLLAAGQIHRLLWDLWLQGYWPPAHSLYQMPFYLVLGGGITAGLWSSLVAFGLMGVMGSAVLLRQVKDGGVLAAAVFVALIASSPFLLAYASVAMTEMPGALAEMLVILAYVRYRERPQSSTATLCAVSLTILFFVKYNYFILLVVPLVLHEWLERTAGWRLDQRLAGIWRWTRRALASPAVAIAIIYVIAMAAVLASGGFDARVMGQRISVHTIGNTGHVVLYLMLARLWYLHHVRRIDWQRLFSVDPRIRPLFIWFVVPVTVWMAAPYPNHIRDFVNLVINLPVGEPTVSAGLASYLDALRTSYFYNPWLLAFAVLALMSAALSYRRQPPVMQWLLLAIPLQFAVVALHRTRWPRYLLLTVVLLCLAASGEVGRWFAGSRRSRIAAGVLAPLILLSGLMAAGRVVTEERFRVVAFENYTDNDALRAAVESIRGDLHARDRLAIVGLSNELSPALVRLELGPASGVRCFPFEVGGARGKPLALATRVLLIAPPGDSPPPDLPDYAIAQQRAVLEQAARGELVLRRQFSIPDLQLMLRLYDRVTKPATDADCDP